MAKGSSNSKGTYRSESEAWSYSGSDWDTDFPASDGFQGPDFLKPSLELLQNTLSMRQLGPLTRDDVLWYIEQVSKILRRYER